jgi:hypothetical protein
MPSALDALTEKEKLFVVEYAKSMDRLDAAARAGYQGSKNVLSTRASRILGSAKGKAALAEIGTKFDTAMLSVDYLIEQLYNAIDRNILPFVDAEGYLKCDPASLPPAVQQCIEGFEVDNEYDRETGELTRQKIKLKFIPKIKAIELAMKFRQMLAPNTLVIDQSTNVNFNWNKFYEPPPENPINQIIEGKLNEQRTKSAGQK